LREEERKKERKKERSDLNKTYLTMSPQELSTEHIIQAGRQALTIISRGEG
jgi:transglutaminase/protease-like cytokinesis protein 3